MLKTYFVYGPKDVFPVRNHSCEYIHASEEFVPKKILILKTYFVYGPKDVVVSFAIVVVNTRMLVKSNAKEDYVEDLFLDQGTGSFKKKQRPTKKVAKHFLTVEVEVNIYISCVTHCLNVLS